MLEDHHSIQLSSTNGFCSDGERSPMLEVVQAVLVVRKDEAGGRALLGYLHDCRDVERPRPVTVGPTWGLGGRCGDVD
jgi:hypothetical protein